MFSNRSVRVHPSAAAMAYAFAPDAFNVLASLRNAGNVVAGFAPASLKSLTLYQTVDLLAALKKRPYSFPFTVPRVSHTGASFFASVAFANVIGFAAPRRARSRISPGCGRMATLGGLPPATAVDTSCGLL